jgi:hypothetical protein
LIARSVAEAVRAYVSELRRALAPITDAHVSSAPSPRERFYRAFFTAGVIPLRASPRLGVELTLRFIHEFEAVTDPGARRRWAVQPRGYIYEVRGPDRRELFAYHWHQLGSSVVTWPHLHIYTAGPLSGIHFPTRRLSLEAFVYLVVHELALPERLVESGSPAAAPRPAYQPPSD